MHPIIKEYLDTNTPLAEILEKYHQKDNYLEVVFLEIAKPFFFEEETRKTIYSKIDLALIKGHEDQNIYFLFLSKAIAFVANSEEKLEIAKGLYFISTSISQENIYQIIQAYYMQAVSVLKFSEHKINESIKLMKMSLQLIDKKHLRYSNLLLNYASMIAAVGRLNELDESELSIFNSTFENHYAFQITKAKIRNCVMTGNYKDGPGLVREILRLSPDVTKSQDQHTLDIFKILSGDLNEDHYKHEESKELVRILHSLSIGKIEEIIGYNKFLLNKSRLLSPLISDYISFNIELSLGKIGSARKLLEEKGDFHYLDDLFYARIQLMENNIDDAYRSMTRLLENVNRYGAMNRVIFELQFAKELKSSDLFMLMNKLKNSEVITEPKIIKSSPVTVKAKGINLLLGKSFEINQVRNQIKKYATLNEIILVTGETGTGKELVAKALHDESPFQKEPFLAINCGALTDTLLESELFGYEAGSFTGAVKQKKGVFEAAGNGTAFLDEFGDVSPKMQVSLLRLLESNEIRMIGGTANRKVECRIVIATNIELKNAVKEKKFREDLYFRLTRLEINLPPLRARVSDIPELVTSFLEGSTGIFERQKIVSAEVLRIFSAYQWPGNIRELKNCLDRLKILNPEKDILNVEDLNFIQFQGAISLPKSQDESIIQSSLTIEHLENKIEIPLNEDPILKIINQKGFKSKKRIVQLKQLFQKYEQLTLGQITEIAKVNPLTATKDLQKLCEEGYIAKKTPTKSNRSNYYEIVVNPS